VLLKHCNHYTTGLESSKKQEAQDRVSKTSYGNFETLAAFISTIDFKSMDIHEWMIMTTEL
jgi:hypothetical protein